jgi:hypothetical protein
MTMYRGPTPTWPTEEMSGIAWRRARFSGDGDDVAITMEDLRPPLRWRGYRTGHTSVVGWALIGDRWTVMLIAISPDAESIVLGERTSDLVDSEEAAAAAARSAFGRPPRWSLADLVPGGQGRSR